jgi:hypothetical protein
MRAFLKILILVTMIAQNSLAANADSRFMRPQPAPLFGPWFEGWYIRVVDAEKNYSFATITTTSTHENTFLPSQNVLPGYKALVVAPPDSAKTFSVEEFPEATELIRSQPQSSELWQSSDGSLLTSNGLDLKMLESNHRVEIQFTGEHTSWNKNNPDWGPAGLAGFSRLLPLQWFVVSTKTPVTYKVTRPDGQVDEGSGFAHIEKNWGKTFPKAWMWIQGISEDSEHQLANAGGPLGLGPVQITAFLVGVRAPGIHVNIHPAQGPQVKYKTWSNPCEGKFKLRANNLRYTVEVTARAPLETFVPLAIPTKKGYLPNLAQESFYSTIQVKVWDQRRLVYEHQYTASALEFGADYICKN